MFNRDPILFWNDVAMEVHRRDFTPGLGTREVGGPTRTSRAFAIVHLAMNDALHAVDGTPAPYLTAHAAGVPMPSPMTAPAAAQRNRAAAVTGAAIVTLSALWDSQKDFVQQAGQHYYDYLACDRGVSGTAIDASAGFGELIGIWLLRVRRDDMSTMGGVNRRDDTLYINRSPHHRPDPMDPDQPRLSSHWGLVTPFCIKPAASPAALSDRYIAPPPKAPALGVSSSARYNAAVDDVRLLGAASAPARSPEQTVIGIYWGYDGANGLGVPPRLYNQVVRAFVDSQTKDGLTMTTEDYACLFAQVHVGMADAAIVAWAAKYHYDLWRPVIGIREHAPGFGPCNGAGADPSRYGDPCWLPLGAPQTNASAFGRTPEFPAYPSGHATFGAVAFRITALFFAAKTGKSVKKVLRDEPFTFVSDEYNGANKDPRGDVRVRHERTLTLASAIVENALSRVYLGVHWRFDGIGTKAPAGLEGEPIDGGRLGKDPAAKEKAETNEERIGGVPIGLQIADEVARHCPCPLPNKRPGKPPVKPPVKPIKLGK